MRGEHYTGTEMGELRTQYPIKGGSVAFGETDCSARWQVLRRVTNEPARRGYLRDDRFHFWRYRFWRTHGRYGEVGFIAIWFGRLNLKRQKR